MRRKCVLVQQWWRRRLAARDPITLGPVRGETVWAEGTLFSAAPLRDYVRATGDTRHPITRHELTPRVLRRLAVGDVSGSRCRSAEDRGARELTVYLEREVAGVAARIAQDVAGRDIRATVVRLVQVRFPAFHAAVEDLGRAGGDRRAAVQRAVTLLLAQQVPPGNIALYMIARSFLVDMLARS